MIKFDGIERGLDKSIFSDPKTETECNICNQKVTRYVVLGAVVVCNECNSRSPLDNLGNIK